MIRRDFLRRTSTGALSVLLPNVIDAQAAAPQFPRGDARITGVFDVRAFGAVGDGRSIDTPAVNRAIAAEAMYRFI